MDRSELALYRDLLGDIKLRVRRAQAQAARSVNTEMILLYWDIGCMILERQDREGWGAGVIPRLAAHLKNELPDEKGFSERNLGYMIQFAREYGGPPNLQQPAAKLPESLDKKADTVNTDEKPILQQPPAISPQLAVGLPWFHHVVLIQKVKNLPTRLCYAQQALKRGWSRDTLTVQIKNRAHERHGVFSDSPRWSGCHPIVLARLGALSLSGPSPLSATLR